VQIGIPFRDSKQKPIERLRFHSGQSDTNLGFGLSQRRLTSLYDRHASLRDVQFYASTSAPSPRFALDQLQAFKLRKQHGSALRSDPQPARKLTTTQARRIPQHHQ